MQNSFQKKNIILKNMNNLIVDLPTPSNLSMWWNFGSLSGLCLGIQILSGIFLAMFYTNDISTAFNSIDQIMRNVNSGWFIRLIHANGASFMFICLYIHMSRSLYYLMYLKKNHMWESGTLIFILTMATAFFGYILPWGQMSFWGATVITSLFSSIPFIGKTLMEWIWGSFAVEAPTLTRFFALHFITPFLLSIIMILHLIFLHTKGSTNPMGINSNIDKTSMHIYFSWKDIMGFLFIILILILLSLLNPYLFMEPDNFLPANSLSTPPHIQPEWYFLFTYTILRSIPNKFGGFMALIFSLMILFVIPKLFWHTTETNLNLLMFKPIFWIFINIFIILTWIGMCPVEPPFESIGKIMSFLYFLYFIITPFILMTNQE